MQSPLLNFHFSIAPVVSCSPRLMPPSSRPMCRLTRLEVSLGYLMLRTGAFPPAANLSVNLNSL
jgi:hypothetical protein